MRSLMHPGDGQKGQPLPLSRMLSQAYAKQKKQFLSQVEVSRLLILREMVLTGLLGTTALAVSNSFFVEEVLRHFVVTDNETDAIQAQRVITSIGLTTIPNAFLSAAVAYIVVEKAKIDEAIRLEKVVNDLQHTSPAANASFKDKASYYGHAAWHEFQHKGLIFFPQFLMGLAAFLSTTPVIGRHYPIFNNPGLFWPMALVGGIAYGRLFYLLETSAFEVAASNNGGSMAKALASAFWGLRTTDESGRPHWKGGSQRMAWALIYVAWGVLLSEFLEGKFGGDEAGKSIIQALTKTLPEDCAPALMAFGQSGFMQAYGFAQGVLIASAEGVMGVFNAQRNMKFWSGMPTTLAILVGLSGVAHALPSMLAMMGLIVRPSTALPLRVVTAIITGAAVMPPNMMGFTGTVADGVRAMYAALAVWCWASWQQLKSCGQKVEPQPVLGGSRLDVKAATQLGTFAHRGRRHHRAVMGTRHTEHTALLPVRRPTRSRGVIDRSGALTAADAVDRAGAAHIRQLGQQLSAMELGESNSGYGATNHLAARTPTRR